MTPDGLPPRIEQVTEKQRQAFAKVKKRKAKRKFERQNRKAGRNA